MSAFAPVALPQFATAATVVGLAMLAVGLVLLVWPTISRDKSGEMSKKTEVAGLRVEHDGDGPAMEINHAAGTVGAVINAAPIPGQDVIGAHVVTKGGGVVVNTYPGSQGPGLTINVGPKP